MQIEQWAYWQWIQFHVGKQVIPYSLETLFPHQKMWARMNMVTDMTIKNSIRILVPEHILSLLVILSVQSWWWFRPDVSIYLPKSTFWKEVFVPVLWPGITCNQLELLQEIVGECVWSKQEIGVFDAEDVLLNNKKSSYDAYTNNWESVTFRKWAIREASWCYATVLSNTQSDVIATISSPSESATIDFDHPSMEFSSARAMWRLSSRPVYCWVKWLHALWVFNGITPENYFLAWPRSTTETIRTSMQERYRSWFNEHSYHTLYADFPWELAALAASLGVDRFHAEFMFENMRHHDRLERFTSLKTEQIFTQTKREESI
jgi:hypothetical protein